MARKAAKAKRPAKAAPLYDWNIYRLRATPAAYIGMVQQLPDAASAVAAAIDEFSIPPNLHDRLMAVRVR